MLKTGKTVKFSFLLESSWTRTHATRIFCALALSSSVESRNFFYQEPEAFTQKTKVTRYCYLPSGLRQEAVCLEPNLILKIAFFNY